MRPPRWQEEGTLFQLAVLVAGNLALLTGVVVLIFLLFLRSVSLWYWCAPLAGILVGCWLLARGWGLLVLLLSLLATFLLTYEIIHRYWPSPPIPFNAAAQTVTVAPLSHKAKVLLKVPDTLRRPPFNKPRFLQTPPGFRIGLFASGLPSPRFMAVGPQGFLYVSLPEAGEVVVLPDANGDGVADRTVIFASDLHLPHGLAFRGRDLVVAENDRLLLLHDEDGDLHADRRQVLSRDLPAGGGHWTRSVAIGPDGDYYVSVGSSCNVCREQDLRRAAILRFSPGGGTGILFARGLRNSVGIAFSPDTGQLWGADNGRDGLGDDLPPDEINRIVDGGNYGWPYCYGDRIPDPDLGTTGLCRRTLGPAVSLPAHSAPLGIAFGRGLHFPAPYRDMLFVAFHGSWNRSVPTGYKLVGIPFRNGHPDGLPRDIVTGWLQGRHAWGRPVDPVVGADGALYLTDDRAGAVYRLSFAGTSP